MGWSAIFSVRSQFVSPRKIISLPSLSRKERTFSSFSKVRTSNYKKWLTFWWFYLNANKLKIIYRDIVSGLKSYRVSNVYGYTTPIPSPIKPFLLDNLKCRSVHLQWNCQAWSRLGQEFGSLGYSKAIEPHQGDYEDH